MTYFYYLIIFTLGSSIVSFLTVVAHDFPKIDLKRRSSCDNCHTILRWYELIPILGFIFIEGKCSKCNTKVPLIYPVTELIGGMFFLTIIIQNRNLYMIVPVALMLIFLSFMDHYYGYVYSLLYLISLPTYLYAYFHNYQLHLIIGFLVYSVLIALNRLYNNIGLGDVELIALLAILFGLEDILKIILIACLTCIFSFVTNKKRSFRFIPYLTISTGIIYLISY
ncbi:prepilin peptidase [Companilactobacillus insicii]|uniref:prepilin peptidase n=1 Tax=Companilactobacillus insicii TaxID=1732567 RepID=UPI000F7A3097|nr:A24 family peptidase [Companilactobacillus insicii]